MARTQKETESRFASRRRRLLSRIKGEAVLIAAAPLQVSSRDLHFPYRQDSDFLYFTGINEPDAALLLLGSRKGPRSVLFLRDSDAQAEQWGDSRIGLRRAKRRHQVDEVRDIASLSAALPKLLRDAAALHYAPGCNASVDSLVWSIFRTTVGPRMNFPRALIDSRMLTSEMRIVKDREEIRTLRHVTEITAKAFAELMRQVKSLKSERHAADTLEAIFSRLGAEGPSFQTIVASGKNATILHHRPSFQPLWRRELVLIDAGASFRGYAADITRTIPVSGKFSTAQADVYDVVHRALQKATEKCGPNASLDEVHQVCVRAITRGLIDLGVLRGSVAKLVSAEAYKPYFMHRTSHWLGLDVHDISPIYMDEYVVPPSTRPFEPGNVFTIEPGLYFSANDETVPKALRGIGIRLEDDILITKTGHDVLTKDLPSRREEIEALMS